VSDGGVAHADVSEKYRKEANVYRRSEKPVVVSESRDPLLPAVFDNAGAVVSRMIITRESINLTKETNVGCINIKSGLK
jgi:hypothetical protein